MQQRQKIQEFLHAALEMTIYLSPADLWLTPGELFEATNRAGFLDGEVSEILPQVATMYFGANSKVKPIFTQRWHLYTGRQDPDYNDYGALDFIVSELNTEYRKFGSRNAIDRSVLVERAVATGHARAGAEAAIGMLEIMETVSIDKGRITMKGYQDELPSAVMAKFSPTARPSEARRQAHGIVRDIVARRQDGRPKHSNSLEAFAERLEVLGHKAFRLWWMQTLNEFRQTNANTSPLAKLVLAAALVEAALTFVVARARPLGLGPFQSATFDEPSHRWKIDDLVKSASAGQQTAIFDANVRGRIEQLIKSRQRIHAGRMLSEYPKGVPDLRPEEANEAQLVAEIAVRNILTWLESHGIS